MMLGDKFEADEGEIRDWKRMLKGGRTKWNVETYRDVDAKVTYIVWEHRLKSYIRHSYEV